VPSDPPLPKRSAKRAAAEGPGSPQSWSGVAAPTPEIRVPRPEAAGWEIKVAGIKLRHTAKARAS
jgi:hypothetical protein